MSSQKLMEEHMVKTMHEVNVEQAKIMNGMMQSEYVSCNYEELSVTMRYPVLPWQANRVGVMHGGAISAAFDLSMAALARFVATSNFTPTISLEIKFIRPVNVGQHLLIKTRATTAGKRVSQFTAEAVIEETGKLAATSTSVYMNIDTTKEHK